MDGAAAHPDEGPEMRLPRRGKIASARMAVPFISIRLYHSHANCLSESFALCVNLISLIRTGQ